LWAEERDATALEGEAFSEGGAGEDVAVERALTFEEGEGSRADLVI
jgi:hypothetical protein